MSLPTQTNTVVIGASIAGLAMSVSLQKKGITHIILEKESVIARPWHAHYKRLHLHTSKLYSHLPFKRFDRNIPRYPSREQVVDYLEEYKRVFNVTPLFNTAATSIKRESSEWLVTSSSGLFRAKNIVMATGAYGSPRIIDLPGQDSFPGKLIHSSEYGTGSEFKDQQVLVIGFGNSACEIAIDLCEQGATPTMVVRSPVNVIPRDILGIPVLALSIFLKAIPASVADLLSTPLIRWAIGDVRKLGLIKKSYGPIEQIQKDGTAPVLDIGTIKLIRNKKIKIVPGIRNILGNTVEFADGQTARFDAIVACIGYVPRELDIVTGMKHRIADLRLPIGRQKYFGEDGLYFCGFWISPTGQIREIARDAKIIAADINKKTGASFK